MTNTKSYTVVLEKNGTKPSFTALNSDNYKFCVNGLYSSQKSKGISPMEMMLTAAGGCAGIDVLSMLKDNSGEISEFTIHVNGERNLDETPAYFRNIEMIFTLKTELPTEKIIRSIELSLEKYCTVGKTLEAFAEINWRLILNGIEATPCTKISIAN